MKKYAIGFILGAALAVTGYAIGATQSSATVTISCNTDGTMNLATVPR